MSAVTAVPQHAVDAVRASARRGRRRSRAVGTTLTAIALALAGAALMLGDYDVPPGELAQVLSGHGSGLADFVVLDLRLPRLTMGVLVAVAFGLSGAVFQGVLRNPLASPDIIGVSGGASVGAVLALVVLGLSGPWVSLTAFGAALAVAAATYLLSWNGGVAGQRFVLTGVGLAFVASSVLGYLLTRSDVHDAQTAMVWMVGSLGSPDWDAIALVAIALVALVPLTAAAVSRLRLLQLGDETATALGVRSEPARAGVLVLAVALAAVATAAVGPVAFVAFTAPPVARRLVGDGGPALLMSALTAVVIVLSADLAAQHLLPQREVPVGIVTGAVGGPFLLWLLATSGRALGRSGGR